MSGEVANFGEEASRCCFVSFDLCAHSARVSILIYDTGDFYGIKVHFHKFFMDLFYAYILA